MHFVYCVFCLQGYLTTTNLKGKDWAKTRLFASFDEERVFSRPTYRGAYVGSSHCVIPGNVILVEFDHDYFGGCQFSPG